MTKHSNTIFEREFRRLNSAQKEAVETIEGPVMVIAGPGTGKTQVVAMRIAQILNQTQISARNILALTFTDAGVTALRTRLETIIGPDAYQVTVATFHGFANEIVATFPYVFGFAVEASQVTELERLQLISQIVERSNSISLLRPVRSPTFHVSAIASAIGNCKQENITPEQLRNLAKDEADQALKTPKLTAVKKLAVERQKQINLELADVFESYQEQLANRNLYDYEDMIIFAVRGLSSEPDVRAYYQERYQYILVDEYQDTNNAQNALVEALSEFYPNPNLCVVGDDKQAIYRFQGASVTNMLHFAQKYSGLKIITLQENYRSTPSIVEAATELIGNNQHQLVNYLPNINPELHPTRQNPDSQLKLVSFPTPEAQSSWIVEQIQKRHRQGVPFEQMAVLFRRNEEIRSFRQFALKASISVAGVETTNLLLESEIQQIMRLLAATVSPNDPLLLVPALNLVTPLSPITLARLASLIHQGQSIDIALKELLKPIETKQVENAFKRLISWASQIHLMALTELIEKIIFESRIIKEINRQPNALERLELIKAFINEASSFATHHPQHGLADFLNYIGLLGNFRVRLPVARLAPTKNGVFVSTVHGAKGLEFDTVFLANVSTAVWNDRPKPELIKLPTAIVGLKTWNDAVIEDERRLFYVGITRAKNCLYFGYSRFNTDGRELLPSQFISEIDDKLTRENFEPSSVVASEILQTTLSPISPIVLRDQEKILIRELITNNPFSYTHFKTYRLCPKQYLLKNVLKFPTKPEARLVYGSLLHRALELFYKQYRSRKVLPSEKVLINYLDQAARQTENFPNKRGVVDRAKVLLKAYYASLGQAPTIPEGVEYSFTAHHVLLDDIWITGKFDRIDPINELARTVRVIDYKTGSQAQSRNQIEGKTKATADLSSNLREQLVFYSLLAGLDRQFPYQATEFCLKFLDDKHTFREEIFSVSADERTKLAGEVKAAYQEIVTLDQFSHSRDQFDQGCELCQVFSPLD